MTALAFVVLAGTGAVARWMLTRGGPAGTLLANVAGSFLLDTTANWTGSGVTVVGIGALGAFTTMSTFAADTTALAEGHDARWAGGYVAATLTLGIGAAWLGLVLVT